ncbi:MAG TPA: BtrH N-terminal domain-containing protein, partial [Rhizobacter sp.]|nr:BtrH N-terminal domain-containing protein [Rhizobacter sp.]
MNFQHQHAAHCESGVISSLMRQNGVPMSESLAFGLSAGLAFAYLPFIKLSGL